MFSSENWFGASAGFFNGVATQSLRCDSASNPKLVLDGTSGNRKTWSWSCWVKRSSLGSAQIVFNVGVTGVDEIDFHFTAGDEFIISDRGGHNLKTAQLFRDTSAWYNLVVVMDTEQSGVTFSSDNALKLYVNGVRVTDYGSGTSLPDEDDEFSVNHTRIHHIATRNLGDNDFDGYLAEMNLVDGIAVGETNGYLDEFGELKNGVWIPKKYTGAYGNNGFRLQFNQTGTGTGASDTVGADSANSNHFDSSGIDTEDCAMIDSPENNFSTLNPLDKSFASSALSEANLSVSAGTGSAWNNIINSTFSLTSGKWYWEVYQNGTGGFGKIGVRQNNSLTSADSHSAGASEVYLFNGNKQQGSTSTDSSYYGSAMYADGNIFGIALDMDAGKIWVAKNNTYGGSADPTTGNGAMFTNLTEPQSPSFSSYNMAVIFNFGQDSSFAGNKTSGSANAQDANGIGDFYYAPPSDFLALCTSNLPEPLIGANSDTQADNYFGTLTWSGDDNTTRKIATGESGVTGTVDFTPDWSWIKRRNGSSNGSDHLLLDIARGVDLFNGLSSNGSSQEGQTEAGSTWINFGDINNFENGGFTVQKGSDVSHTLEGINQSGGTYVGWNWKAGGSTSSNTDGSITSNVSANTDAGLSIVTYTSNNSAGATVGHGLTVGGSAIAPQMVIIKKRSASERWFVWHGADPTRYIYLNETFAGETSNLDDRFGNNSSTTLPSPTVLTLGTSNDVNGSSGSTYVAYCFAEVEGYSKFGSYTGNGSPDGTFVYLGFRASFILTKCSSNSSTNWFLHDEVRNPINPANINMHPNLINSEGSVTTTHHIDILSNGFKPRGTGAEINGSGRTYIYMAFAKVPFKYSLAR